MPVVRELTLGNDQFTGDSNDEKILAKAGDDQVNGAGGNDEIYGDLGNDTLYGDVGNDRIDGGWGNDSLYGGSGTDTLVGDLGDDYLRGGTGNDTLLGGSGLDRLIGDAGNDVLTGGLGDDKYFFSTGVAFSRTTLGVDTITDFDTTGLLSGVSQDKIVLSKATFTALQNGLTFEAVEGPGAAETNSAAIVYIKSTGQLVYNPNGSAQGFGGGDIGNLFGANGGVFAVLSNKPQDLSKADFQVIT